MLLNIIIFAAAGIIAYVTSNILFLVFGILWILFQFLDKKTDNNIKPINNTITKTKEL